MILPKNWCRASLDDLFLFIGGGTPEKGNPTFWDGNINWATVKDIKNKFLFNTIDKVTEIAVNISNAELAEVDDLVLVTRISPGEVSICKEVTTINQDLKIIKKFGGISSLFAYYMLLANKEQIISKSSGTTVKGLRIDDLKDIYIGVPPLNEQERIVDKIEELLSELEKANQYLLKSLNQLEKFKQVVLIDAYNGKLTEKIREEKNFISAKELLNLIKQKRKDQYEFEMDIWAEELLTWEVNKTGKRPTKPSKPQPYIPIKTEEYENLADLPNGWMWECIGNFSFVTKLAGFEFSEFVLYQDTGEVPVIKAQNVTKKGFKEGNFSFIDKRVLEFLPRINMNGGEILFVFIGAGIGNVGIVPVGKKYLLGPNVAMIRVSENIDNKYIEYFLSSAIGKKHIMDLTKATAQGSISMDSIRRIVVPIASYEEQLLVVDIIDYRFAIIEKLEETIKKNQRDIAILQQKVLKEAFEGKLVNNNLEDEPAEKLIERIYIEKTNYMNERNTLRKNTSKDRKDDQKKIDQQELSIIDILKSSTNAVPAKEVWERSMYRNNIEEFYAALKKLENEVIETQKGFLTIKNEN